MGVRKIRVLGNPVLREKTQKVTHFDENLEVLVSDMIETMREYKGVGLAAPQVGVSKKVVVVETLEDEKDPESNRLYVLINPKIARFSEEMVEGIEGCLSVPGYVGEVVRHQSVLVRAQGLQGQKLRIKAQDFLARVFQHELDHLEGVLFVDKLTDLDRIWKVEEGTEEQAEAEGTTVNLEPATLVLE